MQHITKQQVFDVLRAGALGDAFGYPIEFDDWDSIHYRFGGRLTKLLADPTVSDDTQMTLFVCEGLANSHMLVDSFNPEYQQYLLIDQHEAFLNWYYTQDQTINYTPKNSKLVKYPKMLVRRAPGATCLTSLNQWINHNYVGNDSKGCGTVMRAAPYAFLADAGVIHSTMIAYYASKFTHGHVEAAASSAAFATLIAFLLTGRLNDDQIITKIVNVANEMGGTNTASLITKAYNFAKKSETLHPKEIVDAFGEGWVADEALAVGIYAAFKTKNVWDAIILSANHSGDSDSTASIAAQISAARFGMTSFEKAQFDRLDIASIVDETAESLCQGLNI